MQWSKRQNWSRRWNQVLENQSSTPRYPMHCLSLHLPHKVPRASTHALRATSPQASDDKKFCPNQRLTGQEKNPVKLLRRNADVERRSLLQISLLRCYCVKTSGEFLETSRQTQNSEEKERKKKTRNLDCSFLWFFWHWKFNSFFFFFSSPACLADKLNTSSRYSHCVVDSSEVLTSSLDLQL